MGFPYDQKQTLCSDKPRIEAQGKLFLLTFLLALDPDPAANAKSMTRPPAPDLILSQGQNVAMEHLIEMVGKQSGYKMYNGFSIYYIR